LGLLDIAYHDTRAVTKGGVGVAVLAKRATVIDGLVGERIRAHRMIRGLTQIALAEKLGLTFQQVQKYEKGINRVGAGRLLELADIFQVPIEALFPASATAVEPSQLKADEAREISKFSFSAEGLGLCRAFLRIEDPKLRKTIIALVQELSGR
jgi:transcriptional regulator with XRE-family HTH domain